MIATFLQFQEEAKNATDSQLRWMHTAAEDALAKMSKADDERGNAAVRLSVMEEELTARGL